MRSLSLLLALTGTSTALLKGFNYGATEATGACRPYETFRDQFNLAKNLPNAGGFATARLYTMIQCGTQNDPISAIQAAIDTDTQLLLGLWASAGRDAFAQEMNALMRAINQYGPAFTDRVVGISIGSEDLYRSSPAGIQNNAGVGETADILAGYIGWARDWLRGTALESAPLGHVDTWTAWILPETAPVIAGVDFLGHNSFPYFESTQANPIEAASQVFFDAVARTESVAGGREVWVTETGWPHRGPTSGQAVASVENAQTYYRNVGCELFRQRNAFYYTLVNANTAQTDMSFAVTDNGAPVFDLSC